jgi:hypothetical protein
MSYPMCAACWEHSRQVAIKYRPGLAVIDHTGPAAAQTSGGGNDRPLSGVFKINS